LHSRPFRLKMQGISDEVCFAIVLFEEHVTGLLPKTNKEMDRLQAYMTFPSGFAAIDGFHLPIKRSSGPTAQRDHLNYKEFYSSVLMAMVDGKGRLSWANCGMPGNVHNVTLLRSTNLWHHLPRITAFNAQQIDNVQIPANILADSAFPHLPYIQKPLQQY